MRLPKFIRQFIASVRAHSADEWGGFLYDYANGQWRLLADWEDEPGLMKAMDLVGNMMDRGQDAVYIAMVKVGPKHGYCVVHNSEGEWWERSFWGDIYPIEEAFDEVVEKARKAADDLGFRRPQ